MKISEITTNYTNAVLSSKEKNIPDDKRDEILLNYSLGKLWNKNVNEYNTHTNYIELFDNVNNSFITPFTNEELKLKYIDILKKILEIKKDLNTPIEIDETPQMEIDDEENDVVFNFDKLPDGHLIKKYVEYGNQIMDAYSEYHFINILTLISYLIPARQTPRYGFTYNNIWAIGLGIAGASGKTTTVEKNQEVIDLISSSSLVKRMPTKPTPEAFVEELSKINKQLWINDECVGLLKFMDREHATELEDNILKTYSHSSFSYATKKDGVKEVNNPHTPMLWYTTIENFARHSKYERYESGFFQRPLFVLPMRKKEIKKDESIKDEDTRLFKDIIQHCLKLNEIGLKYKVIDFQENDIINNWKVEERNKIRDVKSDIQRGARTRSYEHVRKLAMIITLGSKEFLDNVPKYSQPLADKQISLTNYIPDWAAEIAIEWTESFIKNFDKMYKISLRENGGSVQKVMKLLQENEYVRKIDLLNATKKTGKAFDEFMNDLINEGLVQIVNITRKKGRPGTYYQLVKEEVNL